MVIDTIIVVTKRVVKMKKSILFAFMLGLSALAQAEVQDSIGQKTVNGKNYILYKVEQSETLYSLSKKYNVTVTQINDANDGLKEGLKFGSTIMIPSSAATTLTSTTTTAKPIETAVTNVAAIHVVALGETLYAISKKYNVTVDEIKQWNNLSSNDVSLGQELKVSKAGAVATNRINGASGNQLVVIKGDLQVDPAGTVDYKNVEVVKSVEPIVKRPEYTIDTSLYGEEITISRTIEKISEVGIDQEKNLAQFTGVKVGTILMVVNPVTNKATFVRVVGPANGANIVVTNSVLKTLGLTASAASKVNVSYTR